MSVTSGMFTQVIFSSGSQGVAQLKKLRRAEGGVKIVGVFSVKNHDFTPKNHIFFNFRGGARRVRERPLDPPLILHIAIIKRNKPVRN